MTAKRLLPSSPSHQRNNPEWLEELALTHGARRHKLDRRSSVPTVSSNYQFLTLLADFQSRSTGSPPETSIATCWESQHCAQSNNLFISSAGSMHQYSTLFLRL